MTTMVSEAPFEDFGSDLRAVRLRPSKIAMEQFTAGRPLEPEMIAEADRRRPRAMQSSSIDIRLLLEGHHCI
ncbi:hypothetical protein ACFFV8_00115 [Sphingobium indicum]|uniref:hypothetical protein n=1 Tax=Sphingobium indicum TaxID=332055 RepID=UPI0035E6EC7D